MPAKELTLRGKGDPENPEALKAGFMSPIDGGRCEPWGTRRAVSHPLDGGVQLWVRVLGRVVRPVKK